MNFKELYLANKVEFEEIDDYCFIWGNGEEPVTLCSYLGFNDEEEEAWISESEEALKEILDRQKI